MCANIYRHIKRRVGQSFKRAYSKGKLVPSRKQAAYQFSGTEGSLLGLKSFPRPLLKQDSFCGSQQHNSGVIHNQGRRHEVGLIVCSPVENLYLVCQETQSPTYSRLTICGNRQTIQARSDHPNRVVSPSRGLSVKMQQPQQSICTSLKWTYFPSGSTTSYF